MANGVHFRVCSINLPRRIKSNYLPEANEDSPMNNNCANSDESKTAFSENISVSIQITVPSRKTE